MKNRISLLALRIATLREEFSESEILEAVRILEEHGSTSALLSYLADRQLRPDKKRHQKTKAVADQRSKAVLMLAHKDPDKFYVLSEFDSLLRKSGVLPHVDDIKKLGQRLSKSFAPRNSRRESISKLMTLLAARPLDEIREVVKATLSTARIGEEDNDYQRLAQFIITGKASPVEREQTA